MGISLPNPSVLPSSLPYPRGGPMVSALCIPVTSGGSLGSDQRLQFSRLPSLNTAKHCGFPYSRCTPGCWLLLLFWKCPPRPNARARTPLG